MPPRQQPRRIARELALLSLSQVKNNSPALEREQLDKLVLAAVRTLAGEARDILETAAGEVKRGHEQLLGSETRATEIASAKAMVKDALELAQTAINRLGGAVEIPEFVQLANQHEVREYAMEIIATVHRRRAEIEAEITSVMVDWQLHRLARIDRDTLKIAVAEMLFLNTPHRVAINEAVELAKNYSDDDGYRFVNGVLRKVSDRLRVQARASQA